MENKVKEIFKIVVLPETNTQVLLELALVDASPAVLKMRSIIGETKQENVEIIVYYILMKFDMETEIALFDECICCEHHALERIQVIAKDIPYLMNLYDIANKDIFERLNGK